MKKEEFKKGEIIIYKTPDKKVRVDVKLEKDTIWLTQAQIALLFGTKRPAITKHLDNIFGNKELDKKAVCSILEHTAADGKMYKTQFYNLDAIISVGYRVNSKQATQFRIWATKTLKDHLVRGYTVNEKRLLAAQNNFKELQNAVSFLKEKAGHQLLAGQEQEILQLLSSYSKTLTLLDKYDKKDIPMRRGEKGKFVLTYEEASQVISAIKKDLISKKEASELFGQEYEDKFKGILGNIRQSFGDKELYPSIEEKAAHFLYFAVKDHPFVDGNKRIASFLFVYFLDRNQSLYKESGERKIDDNALTVLTLLTAASDPKEKDILIKLITNLIL